jgi:hypothetical protein
MELGMMVSGIVCNDNDTSPTSRTGLPEAFEKHMERQSVKLLLLFLENQFPIAQTDSSEIAHALTSGMMQQYRVLFLRRDPYQTTRSILLEMNFINRPQIDFGIGCEPPEFFYMPPEAQGQPGQSEGVVCADESQRI